MLHIYIYIQGMIYSHITQVYLDQFHNLPINAIILCSFAEGSSDTDPHISSD